MHQDPASTAVVMGIWATIVPALYTFTLGEKTTGRARKAFLATVAVWVAASASTAVLALLGAADSLVLAGKVITVLAVATACGTWFVGGILQRRAEEKARWAWMD